MVAVSCVLHRAGAPPLPPAPYAYRAMTGNVRHLRGKFGRLFASQADAILTKYGISHAVECTVDEWSGNPIVGKAQIMERSLPDQAGTTETVLHITAWWTEESERTWQDAARELKQYVDDVLAKVGAVDVSIGVDMQAPEVRWPRQLSMAPDDPQLVNDWPYIKKRVREFLDSFPQTKGYITSISLFRMGIYDKDRNPITVYVSLSYDSREQSWKPVTEAVQRFLDGFPHKLVLHMENGGPESNVFNIIEPSIMSEEIDSTLVYSDDYQQLLKPGDDIGAAAYILRSDKTKRSPMTGTAGCYLQLRMAGSDEWSTYVLTNYHVIRPCIPGYTLGIDSDGKSCERKAAHRSLLEKTDHAGFDPSQASQITQVESPVRLKHNYTVCVETLRAQGPPGAAGQMSPEMKAYIDEKRARLQTKVDFFDSGRHILGALYAGSGLKQRSPRGGRLDWALCSVNQNRQGRNTIPSHEQWEKAYPADIWIRRYLPSPGIRTMTSPNQHETVPQIADAQSRVFKIGGRTGLATAYFNCYKTDVKMPEWDKYIDGATLSEEYMFFPQSDGRAPALKGDSGAVVYNNRGAVVGLVFSGQKPHNAQQSYMYVTPIQEIFDDIKRLSNGKIADIRVAT